MKWMLFVALMVCGSSVMAQTPVPIPDTVGDDGPVGGVDCEDLRRLIRNTQFAIENQEVVVAGALTAWDQTSFAADTAHQAWEDAKKTGAEWLVDETWNAFVAAYKRATADMATWLNESFKLTCLQSLLRGYKDAFLAGGC